MYTSNYARSGHDPNAVGISRTAPRWFKGRLYRALAPPWNIARYDSPAAYRAAYMAQVLAHLDPREVYRDLGAEAVLLCHERPGEFCHRRLVASWLEDALGITVRELGHCSTESARVESGFGAAEFLFESSLS